MLNDLFEIHTRQINEGKYSLHPQTWLQRFTSPLSWIRIDKPEYELIIGDQRITNHRQARDVFGLLTLSNRRKHGFYYGCSLLADAYESHQVGISSLEVAIKDKIQLYDDSVILESPTPVGYIDCENDTEITEVKNTKHWKHALGQILAYSYFRPSHRLKLHLFGANPKKNCESVITDICGRFDVSVYYEEFM